MGKLNRRFEIKYCACGPDCKVVVKSGLYARGHNVRVKGPHNKGKGKPVSPPHLCWCNKCGLMTNPGCDYIKGHTRIGKSLSKSSREQQARTLDDTLHGISNKPIPNHHPCACIAHCGILVASNKKYVSGHNSYKEHPLHRCICRPDCDAMIREGKIYANGHSNRGKPGWRAGLTKETDSWIAAWAQKMMGRPGWNTGLTKETCPALAMVSKKVQEWNKKLWSDPIYAARRREEIRILWLNPDFRKHQSEIRKALWSDPDYVKKNSEILKLVWANYTEEERNTRVKTWAKSQNMHPNKPENGLFGIVENLYPANYKYTGGGDVVMGGKIPDFININGQKKIIELFGDYWHRGEDPQDRIDIFKPYGYDTLVVWEHELKDVEKLKCRIIEFHERNYHEIKHGGTEHG